ncbi:hypothetical protein [Geodermatophilus sp. CPCC 205506]|uniref:hypothetical protein n=1 Tax=Geodermatophilus sp. CPCC 205506 TaxID=2936596 RepID=UPI003EF00D15
MAGRRRREQDEPLAVRALREQERHTTQVGAYGFFPRRGPRRSATVTPAPLRYWQFNPARPWLVLTALLCVAAWLGLFAWQRGTAGLVDELPLAVLLGVAVLVLSTARTTVSDAGLSFDIAGLRRTSTLHVVARSLVREVRRGNPPDGWPRARSRGGWWPGRTRVAVRHLAADGDGERAFTVWVRDPEAFAEALGRPTAGDRH